LRESTDKSYATLRARPDMCPQGHEIPKFLGDLQGQGKRGHGNGPGTARFPSSGRVLQQIRALVGRCLSLMLTCDIRFAKTQSIKNLDPQCAIFASLKQNKWPG